MDLNFKYDSTKMYLPKLQFLIVYAYNYEAEQNLPLEPFDDLFTNYNGSFIYYIDTKIYDHINSLGAKYETIGFSEYLVRLIFGFSDR